MNFEYSEKSKELQQKLTTFIEEHVVPLEQEFITFQSDTNKITILTKSNKKLSFELKSKQEVAEDIVNTILTKINA